MHRLKLTLLAILALCSSAIGQDVATYKANGLKWGRTHGANLATLTGDFALGATFYDGVRVFQNLGELTGEDFSAEEAAAIKAFRDGYVLPNNGGIQPWYSATDGLTAHALRTGDAESKRAVILISQNAPYHADAPPEASVSTDYSREVAYAMIAMMNAEKLGEARRTRLKLLFEQALGHYDQWFVSKTAANVKPFMAGLTATALIRYCEQIDKDRRIVPTLKTGADWLWANAWRDKEQAFYYETDSQATGAPDLNMLIFPLFAWTYKQNGKPKYRLERAQAIFDGGVKGAELTLPKQFNQQYLRGPEALTWIGAGPTELDLLKAENKALKSERDSLKAKIQKAAEALK